MVQTRSQATHSYPATKQKANAIKRLSSTSGLGKRLSKTKQTKRPRSHSHSPSPSPRDIINNATTNATTAAVALDNPKDTPDWPALPELIWTEVFLLAAASASANSTRYDNGSAWLGSCLRICSRLYPAAIRALFRHLEPDSPARSVAIETAIRRAPSLNYGWANPATFVKSFRVDVGIFRHQSNNFLDNLPNLRHLEFYTLTDDPRFSVANQPRWHYDESLFDPSKDNFRLWGFVWNTKLLPRNWNHARLRDIHQIARFCGLRKVTFRNFQSPLERMPRSSNTTISQEKKEEVDECIRAVGASLEPLQSLRHLAFESSDLVGGQLMLMLPSNLTHLTISNCMDLESHDLAPYLSTRGATLTHLTLRNNQSLDLSFLTALGPSCPRLQELQSSLFQDYSRPMLSKTLPSLLQQDELPSWPASIGLIDLYIRNLTLENADVFLQSLIDNARNLPMLQHLTVRLRLDVPWRLRAEFRETWHHKLQQVFLRPASAVPNTGSADPSGYQSADGPSSSAADGTSSSRQMRKKRRLSPTRASGRIAAKNPGPLPFRASNSTIDFRELKSKSYGEPDSDEFDDDYDNDDDDDDYDDDNDGGGGGYVAVDIHDSNNRSAGASSASIAASSDPKSSPRDGGGDDNVSPDEDWPFIQGLCTTVGLVCDNQKPAVRQYSMEDFTSDTEYNSDEWDGEDVEEHDNEIVRRWY